MMDLDGISRYLEAKAGRLVVEDVGRPAGRAHQLAYYTTAPEDDLQPNEQSRMA